jgi:hypothetical protein
MDSFIWQNQLIVRKPTEEKKTAENLIESKNAHNFEEMNDQEKSKLGIEEDSDEK